MFGTGKELVGMTEQTPNVVFSVSGPIHNGRLLHAGDQREDYKSYTHVSSDQHGSKERLKRVLQRSLGDLRIHQRS